MPCIRFCAVIGGVLLAAAPAAAQFTFTDFVIDSATHGLGSLKFVDVDGDSILDLIGACPDGNQILWWRNDGQDPPGFTRYVIDGNFGLAIAVSHGDLDGDGDPDVLGAAWSASEIAWWRNDGGAAGAWPKQSLNNAHDAYAYDLNQDGFVDILGVGSGADKIVWWENDGADPPDFTRRTIALFFFEPKTVRVADFNGDGNLDVVGSAFAASDIAWWENDGQDPIGWTKHFVDEDLLGAVYAEPVDFDSDGDPDLLATAWMGHEFAWYRNDGDGDAWTKIPVGTGTSAVSIASAHLDGDGIPDLVGAAQNPGGVFTFRSDASLTTWSQETLDDELLRAWPVAVGDLDGDGDIDVVSSSGESSNYLLKWYRNDTETETAVPSAPRSVHGFEINAAPNPFEAGTNVSFVLPRAATVSVVLYDAAGPRVSTPAAGAFEAGRHQVRIDSGPLRGGIYFATLEADGVRVSTKLVLAR